MKFINLKLFRKERNLTQRQLGEALQLPQSTVSYLENGLQEATDNLLECIKSTFQVNNLDGYVYERKTFHNPGVLHLTSLEKKDIIFNNDWNEIMPIDTIEGFAVICKSGKINIAKDGTLLIDRNTGIGYCLSYYIICPNRFNDSNLLLSLIDKKWFDDETLEDFKRAYYIGCRIAGIIPAQQLKEEATPKLFP